jgi:hypothetical protein
MDIGLVLSDFIVQVIFPIVGAIVMILVGLIAAKLNKRFKTEIFTQNLSMMQGLALNAIDYAEEKAATWAKNKQYITSNDKLDAAIAWLMKQTPKISREQAKEYIESMLPVTDSGATNKPKAIE